MLSKTLAVLAIVVAAIGLMLCAGGLIGVWMVNTPATDAITSAAATTEGYLALADSTTEQASTQIGDVRKQIDAFESSIQSMTAEDRVAVADQITTVVQQSLGPTVTNLRTTFATLRTGLITLNRSLESANRIPGVQVPTLTDELQAADQRLAEIEARLTELTTAVRDVTVDGSRVATLTASISSDLAAIEADFDRWNAQIATVSVAVVEAGAAAPGLIDRATVAASLLLILFGAGQVCLILRGIATFRKPQ